MDRDPDGVLPRSFDVNDPAEWAAFADAFADAAAQASPHAADSSTPPTAQPGHVGGHAGGHAVVTRRVTAGGAQGLAAMFVGRARNGCAAALPPAAHQASP